MSASLKFEMALVIARKIVDSGEFPELQGAASGMLSENYKRYWTENFSEWENGSGSGWWKKIKERMPEILEWINRNDS